MDTPPRSATSLMNEAHDLRRAAMQDPVRKAEMIARARELERRAFDAPKSWVPYAMALLKKD